MDEQNVAQMEVELGLPEREREAHHRVFVIVLAVALFELVLLAFQRL